MNLVDAGYISYLDLVKVTSYNPAKILGIDKGILEEGKCADIVVFNPNEEYIYTKDDYNALLTSITENEQKLSDLKVFINVNKITMDIQKKSLSRYGSGKYA